MRSNQCWLPLCLIFAAGMGIRIAVAASHSMMEGDEFDYVRTAQSLMGAQPGDYPLMHPVLFPFLIALFHVIIPDWEWAGRAISLLAAGGLLLLLPLFSRSLFGSPWSGVGAALVVAFYPPLIDLAARPMTEALYQLILLLAVWLTWNLVVGNCEGSALLGLNFAFLWLARREGLIYMAFLGALLYAAIAVRRGLRRAFSTTARAWLISLPIYLAVQSLIYIVRPVPDHYPEAMATLGHVLVLPLLLPILLFLVTLKRDDRWRCALFAVILAPLPIFLIFPEPGRKATALVPYLALFAVEGIRRLSAGRPWRLLVLQLSLVVWYGVQGVSSAMTDYQAPPWKDRIEEREAAVWLSQHLRGGENVAAYDKSVGYYIGRAQRMSINPSGTLAEFEERCRRRHVDYLLVDLRKECTDFPLLQELALSPGSRPGLKMEAVFDRQGSRAVVYRIR